MAVEYWYPNGNDGGWDTSTHTNADEGINGPGLDEDSSGPDDSNFLRETSEGITLRLDLNPQGGTSDIADGDTVTQVRVFLRATRNSGDTDNNIQAALIIGGTSQNVGTPETGHLAASFTDYTLTDSGWDSDWSASQLAGMQLDLTTEQGGMPSAYECDVSEVEVEVTYTAASTDELSAQGMVVMQ